MIVMPINSGNIQARHANRHVTIVLQQHLRRKTGPEKQRKKMNKWKVNACEMHTNNNRTSTSESVAARFFMIGNTMLATSWDGSKGATNRSALTALNRTLGTLSAVPF